MRFRTLGVAGFLVMYSVLAFAGNVYYVSTAGSDDNDGLTTEYPWQTLEKVNATGPQPGDSVLFQRGGQWRGQLRPQSGDETAVITYGAYGEGPLPVLLGSVEKNHPEDWIEEAPNLWATREPVPAGTSPITNADFSEASVPWTLFVEGGAGAGSARDTEVFHSAPASCRITCQQPGKAASDIQWYFAGFSVEAEQWYLLTFRARGSTPFSLPMPRLMKAGAPWSSYDALPAPEAKTVTSEWRTCRQFYKASVSAADGRLTFFLGTEMPAGAVLHLDDICLSKCGPEKMLTRDVGNIIFDGESFCGVKVWNREDLKAQGQYWYDEERHVLVLWSEGNPAGRYKDIECALRDHIIDQSGRSFVTYENLALRYGAAHGIGGGNTHHITVRDCELSYIGGGDQMGGDKTVRFGNGIEFWGSAHDCLVERCRLWEIYDAALTNQSSGPDTPHYNIVYRFNIIWNSEYSFEYWNRPEKSATHDICFDNNTCVNAGHGWGHTQRPDPSGRHLCFYNSPASIASFHVRNNIFHEALGNAFYAPGWTPEQVRALDMDHNAWYQEQGDMIAIAGRSYPRDAFEQYRNEWAKEPHSLVVVPAFADPQERDFRLTAGSACIDAGGELGYASDFSGTRVPQGLKPDIGAFER